MTEAEGIPTLAIFIPVFPYSKEGIKESNKEGELENLGDNIPSP